MRQQGQYPPWCLRRVGSKRCVCVYSTFLSFPFQTWKWNLERRKLISSFSKPALCIESFCYQTYLFRLHCVSHGWPWGWWIVVTDHFSFFLSFVLLLNRSGLIPGDIITHINNDPVASSRDVYRSLEQKGDLVMVVVRNGQRYKVVVSPEV